MVGREYVDPFSYNYIAPFVISFLVFFFGFHAPSPYSLNVTGAQPFRKCAGRIAQGAPWVVCGMHGVAWEGGLAYTWPGQKSCCAEAHVPGSHPVLSLPIAAQPKPISGLLFAFQLFLALGLAAPCLAVFFSFARYLGR